MPNFNTSYVSVQALANQKVNNVDDYFNTSYVSVQASSPVWVSFIVWYFNTSYVSVQEGISYHLIATYRISIHHMFRFKLCLIQQQRWLKKFQYIICFGSSNNNYCIDSYSIIFQYIICFGSSTKLCRYTCKQCRISIHHMFRFKFTKQSS